MTRGYALAAKSFRHSGGAGTYQDEYDRARREGHLDPANIWHLQGRERGYGGAGHNAKTLLSEVSGLLAQFSETLNRRATLFASLEAAKRMTPAQLAPYGGAYGYAVRMLQESQMVNNKGNRPQILRNTGGLLLMFGQFGIAATELMYRTWRDRKTSGKSPAAMRYAFALMLGLQYSVSGTMGLPGAENASDVARAVARIAQFDTYNPERSLRETFGKDVANAILYGPVNAVSGVDVQAKSSLGRLVPGTSALDPNLTAKERLSEAFKITGAAGSYAMNTVQAVGEAANGNADRAFELVAPRSFANLMRAGNMAATGQYNSAFDKKTLDDVTPGEIITKGLGFQPARMAQAQRDRAGLMTDVGIQRQAYRRFFNRAKDAYKAQDRQALNAVVRDMEKWNKDHPEYPVTIKRSAVIRSIRDGDKGWEDRADVPKGMDVSVWTGKGR